MSANFYVERDEKLDILEAKRLLVGDFEFPTVDGTAGQVLTTDGEGHVTFEDTGDVDGPASSTDNAITRFDGTTGKVIQNSTALLSDAGVITSSGLVNAGLTYPTVDGTSGQVVTTNGAGVLSLQTGAGNVNGPASATDNAITRFDGTTGKLIQNSNATLSDGGAITSTGLTVGAVAYPSTDGTSGQVLATNGSGSISFQYPSLERCIAAVSATVVNTDIGNNDHIKFDTIFFQNGTSCVMDVTTPYTAGLGLPSMGRFTTLAGGRRYLMNFHVNNGIVFSGNTGSLVLNLRNATSGVLNSFPMTLRADTPTTFGINTYTLSWVIGADLVTTPYEIAISPAPVAFTSYGQMFIEIVRIV